MSKFFITSDFNVEALISESNKKIGLKLTNNSSFCLNSNKPYSGFNVLSLFSYFLVPTAPSNIASALDAFFKVLSGSGTL